MNDETNAAAGRNQAIRLGWKELVGKYQKPVVWRSAWQVANTMIPYAVLWYLMYLAMAVSYWLALPLAILAAGFMVRIFIIFHDCGHGSFFKSQKANDILGFITGVITLTPYFHWRWEHSIHHGSSGDLDRRGTGDIWTMTVKEYLGSSRWHRLAYRLARNPLVLFIGAPLMLFVVKHRFPLPNAPAREKRSVYWTNVAVLGMIAAMSLLVGLKAYLLLLLTVTMAGGIAGVWLFYVQHQFEGVYWQRSDSWDFVAAAMNGASFYRLPKVLQWFTGSIGFHHIHHLSPRIPNYNLEKCHKAEPLFQTVPPVTLFTSLKSLTFRLWDEQHQRLISFRHLRKLLQQRRQSAPG